MRKVFSSALRLKRALYAYDGHAPHWAAPGAPRHLAHFIHRGTCCLCLRMQATVAGYSTREPFTSDTTFKANPQPHQMPYAKSLKPPTINTATAPGFNVIQ